MLVRVVVLGVVVMMLAPVAAAAPQRSMAAMDYFAGRWDCAGSFPATGKTIASTIRFDRDLDGKVMVKHHDDLPPAGYHAIEIWMPQPDGHGFREVIADNFGGLRTYHSDGWKGGTLSWQGAADIEPSQRFVYAKVDRETFRLDWDVSKDRMHYKLGDTLTCKRRSA